MSPPPTRKCTSRKTAGGLGIRKAIKNMCDKLRLRSLDDRPLSASIGVKAGDILGRQPYSAFWHPLDEEVLDLGITFENAGEQIPCHLLRVVEVTSHIMVLEFVNIRLNGACIPVYLKNGDKINFGDSNRFEVIKLDPRAAERDPYEDEDSDEDEEEEKKPGADKEEDKKPSAMEVKPRRRHYEADDKDDEDEEEEEVKKPRRTNPKRPDDKEVAVTTPIVASHRRQAGEQVLDDPSSKKRRVDTPSLASASKMDDHVEEETPKWIIGKKDARRMMRIFGQDRGYLGAVDSALALDSTPPLESTPALDSTPASQEVTHEDQEAKDEEVNDDNGVSLSPIVYSPSDPVNITIDGASSPVAARIWTQTDTMTATVTPFKSSSHNSKRKTTNTSKGKSTPGKGHPTFSI
jgi:hypothetical protein